MLINKDVPVRCKLRFLGLLPRYEGREVTRFVRLSLFNLFDESPGWSILNHKSPSTDIETKRVTLQNTLNLIGLQLLNFDSSPVHTAIPFAGRPALDMAAVQISLKPSGVP